MIKNGETINVSLVPKNEAEYPEIVKVEILKQLPVKDKQVYIGKLLMAPNQDFGYHMGELLVINVSYEEEKVFAFCEKAMQRV